MRNECGLRQAANVMRNCYSTALKGAQEYNSKFIEFAQANTNAAVDFAQRMSGVKSPSEFVELSTELAQQQFATLTEQTKQSPARAEQVTLATTEPLKDGLHKASTWRPSCPELWCHSGPVLASGC